MNYKEIIEKLKEITSVEDLALENVVNIPKDFIFSEEVEKAKNIKNEANEKLNNHPDIKKKYQDRGEEFKELQKQYNALPHSHKQQQKEYLEFIGIGEIQEIEQYGGEGKGDEWYSVKYFPKHNIYINISGRYSSYNGTDFYGWDDVTEVKPVEKTITDYISVK